MKKSIIAVFLSLAICLPCSALINSEGKIINALGKVEYLGAQVAQWVAAEPLQNLFVKDRVHTASQSKAAILFRDETQVHLNANAELLVRSLSEKKGESSVFELVKGEGWFRTKNPSSDLHVATPTATAAIRGTEINVRIGQDDETILTVVEGQVQFSNEFGSITVNSGEEATAEKGKAPVKRLILNPEDAVQWVIYYPTDFSLHDIGENRMEDATWEGLKSLKAGDPQAALDAFRPVLAIDPWARIGASMAYAALSDWDNALAVVQDGFPPSLEPERLGQLAAISLLTGDVASARSSLDQARALDAASLRALVLASTVELAQNRKEQARRFAQDALAAHPESVSANIAAGEAAQAFFDLDAALRYFTAAITLDAEDIRALVDRARVLFGMGRVPAAMADARKASTLAPKDPQVLSLLGFLSLSTGSLKEASDDFQAAASADSNFGEPHLGLGLLAFKQGKTDDGLWELLIATLLDPKVSLYQSYLGKAYYQVRRFTEGMAALDSAKRLDPNDPTPRLYKSHLLTDLYRYADGLTELESAIALNDNRAVYRGRLLLDQDLAAKNVSIAQVYRKLDLDAWGVSEALNSLSSDFTNASAHLFLADLYGDLPDRMQAQTSEFLQYILFAPVNQNSFNTFNEYTSLFDQPMFTFSTYTEGAYPEFVTLGYPTFYGLGELYTRSGNDTFTHYAMLHYKYEVGARPGIPDQFFFGDAQAKLSLGLHTDLFVHAQYNLDNYGAEQTEIELYGQGSNSVSLTAMNPQVDTNESSGDNLFSLTTGIRHEFALGFPLTVVAQYQNDASTINDPDEESLVPGILLNSTTNYSWNYFDLQTQQLLSLGQHVQVMLGAEGFYGPRDYSNPVRAYDAVTNATILQWTDTMPSLVWGLHSWVWSELQLFDPLHLSAALFFQRDHGEHMFESYSYDYTQIYPALGVTYDLGPRDTLRAAAFQFRTTRMFAQVIYPSAIAGFLLDRNEEDYTLRTEVHVSLDDKLPQLFISNHLYFRDTVYPPLALIQLQSSDTLGLTSDLNWVLGRYFAISVNNQAEVTLTSPFTEFTELVKPGITFTLPVGLSLRVENSFILQKFLTTNIPQLTDSLVNLLDATFRFDFPGKSGYFTVAVTNILDQSYSMFAEALSFSNIYPFRQVTANLSVSL